MGGFLGALGGIGQGFGQGTQVIPDLMAKVQQIQQAQMLLDAKKRQLAAHPALAAMLAQGGMGGGQPVGPRPSFGQQGQDMPGGGFQGGPQQQMTGPPGAASPSGMTMGPGQSSVAPPPNGGPPGVMPPARNGGMPGAPPPPQPPMAGPATQPPVPPPPAAGAQQAGMGSAQTPPGSNMFDPQQTVLKIAAGIKKANPNISPEVLLDATEQFIDLMKGVNPDIRNQLQAYLGQQRLNLGQAGLVQRGDIARERDLTTRRGQDLAHDDRWMNANERVREFDQREARLAAGSGGVSKGDKAAHAAEVGAVRAEVQAARNALQDAVRNSGGFVDPTDPATSRAQKRLDDAMKKMKDVQDGWEAKVTAANAAGQKGGWTPPPGLPDPKTKPDGVIKDRSGKVVARVKNHQYVAP